MDKLNAFFLSNYDKDNYLEYTKAKALLIVNIVLLLLATFFLLKNVATGLYQESIARQIVLPMLINSIFLIDLILIKFLPSKNFVGNSMVSSLIIILLSFFYFFGKGSQVLIFLSGFYFSIAFLVMSVFFSNKEFIVIDGILIIIGVNLIYPVILSDLKPEYLIYAETFRVNFQMIVVLITLILYFVRVLSDKAILLSSEANDKYLDKFTEQKELINKQERTSLSIQQTGITLDNSAETLSESTSEEASGIESISATTEEMSQSLNETSINAKSTKEFSENLEEFVSSSLVIFDTTANSVAKINEYSKIIEDIAEKTEILSINAAIEASRTKDNSSGGFSVIALEIKKLAEKSQVTAVDIQKYSSDAVEKSKQSTKNIHEISALIQKLKLKISDISNATLEQTHSINQINASLNEIQISSQKNAGIADNISIAIKSLNENVQQLQNTTNP